MYYTMCSYNTIYDCFIFFDFSLGRKDFEAETLQVTFLPGQSQRNVCVIIIDDDIKEDNEKFRLLLSVPSSVRAQGVWPGFPYYADVKIIGIVM